MPTIDTRQLNLHVAGKVYDGVAAMAKKASMPVGAYARVLFDAAYSARCKPSGDRDLDTAIARVALLFGDGSLNSAEIGRFVGLSEATVVRTIEGWRAELAGRVA